MNHFFSSYQSHLNIPITYYNAVTVNETKVEPANRVINFGKENQKSTCWP